jgi:hypothetical protein
MCAFLVTRNELIPVEENLNDYVDLHVTGTEVVLPAQAHNIKRDSYGIIDRIVNFNKRAPNLATCSEKAMPNEVSYMTII